MVAYLASALIVLWVVVGAVQLAEGLRPRGSYGFRALNVLAELVMLTLAWAVIWKAWIG